MPKKGFKTITVSDWCYEKLKKIADGDNRSISNFLEIVSEMKW